MKQSSLLGEEKRWKLNFQEITHQKINPYLRNIAVRSCIVRDSDRIQIEKPPTEHQKIRVSHLCSLTKQEQNKKESERKQYLMYRTGISLLA